MAKLTTIVVGIILTTLFISGYSLIIGDLTGNYNTSVSPKLNDTMNDFDSEFDDLTGDVRSNRNTSFETSASQDTDSGFSLSKALVTTKNMITNSFTTVSHLAGTIERYFKINSIFRTALVTTAVVVLIVIFVSAVLNNPLRD
jgi:hypothetical protein